MTDNTNSKVIIDIIIPVLNEEKYLSNCLESVLSFDKPEDVEFVVYVVDGESTDKTKSIILSYCDKYNNFKYVLNPGKIQSYALNRVIETGFGEYILRLDAHAKYPKDYLLNCINISRLYNSDNTGGIVVTLKGGEGLQAAIVQALTTHKFGVGNSAFRTEERVGESDTVPFGFFRKDIFKKIGLFDERLVRCQDYEYNRRIIANGGKIMMDSKIYAEYYNQSTLKSFYKKQLFKEAPYNPYMWYLAPYSFAVRHAITGLFTLGLIFGALLSLIFTPISFLFFSVISVYFIISIFSSIQQSIRFKNILLILILPICFFMFHFIHGMGIIIGLIKLINKTAPVKINIQPWSKALDFYNRNLILPKFVCIKSEYNNFNYE